MSTATEYGLPGPEIYEGVDLLDLQTDLRGWHSTHPVFAELIGALHAAHDGGLHTIVEVGSWKGASAIHMASTRRKLGGDFKVICVDTWLGSLEHWCLRDTEGMGVPRRHGYPLLYFQFLYNVATAGCADVIVPVPLPSTIGAALLHRQEVRPQLVYLDASHAYVDLSADLRTWWPLLAAGGILFGDDHMMPGVLQAVSEFSTSKPEGLLSCHIRDGGFWILHKRS